MIKLLVLAVFSVAVASAATLYSEGHRGSRWSLPGRIVMGDDIDIKEVPYQISVRVYSSHHCGGSIIGKYWIVTAAHCFQTFPLDMHSITAGTGLKNKGGSSHQIAEIITHEGYRQDVRGIPTHDIALVRVVEPFEFDETRQPIDLFNEAEEAVPGSISRITGWGSTLGGGIPKNLQFVDIPIISKSSCNESLAKYNGLPKGQICASAPGTGKDPCHGDSGGPLAIDGRLAGVVSWGGRCVEMGNPGVFTEIASYRAWITAKSGL